MNDTTTVDRDAFYRVDGYEGIAWTVRGYVMLRDENYESTGIGEADTSRVRCVMVGDDRVFEFDVDDLTVLDEDEFCHECGQIGCPCAAIWSEESTGGEGGS